MRADRSSLTQLTTTSSDPASLSWSEVRYREVRSPARAHVCAPQLRELMCSLFEETMRINNRPRGFSSPQTIEQFHEARLVRITHGGFAIRLDPFGMLDP